MKRSALAFSGVVLALMLDGAGSAQQPEGMLDVLTCKVKPEKRADFDAIAKKVADANRRYKGDNFIASQVEYGDQNTVMFSSRRENYAAIDKALSLFESAMKEAFGAPAMMQLERDFNACLISSHAELRRRRPDLSTHAPADLADISKMVGESRWVRTTAVHVRPGHVDEFIAQAKALKEGVERHGPGPATLVSQTVVGQQGTVFYFSSYRKSLAEFDNGPPPLREVLGEEGYSAFQKGNMENVARTEVTLSRFLPELSNAPSGVVDAAPDFWKPKSTAPIRTKPKPADAAKPAE